MRQSSLPAVNRILIMFLLRVSNFRQCDSLTESARRERGRAFKLGGRQIFEFFVWTVDDETENSCVDGSFRTMTIVQLLVSIVRITRVCPSF